MERTCPIKRVLALLVMGVLYNGTYSQSMAENGTSFTSNFTINKGTFVSSGKNRYFVLEPGYFLILEGKDGTTNVKLVIKVLNKTEIVDGVITRVVEEREYHNGELVEISRNFYAIDTLTFSIWYFGEDVDIYENGKIVSHEGSWRSGANGARFGLMMPGLPLIGSRYYQEIAPGIAMDRAEIISVKEVIDVPAGKFENCIKTEETTPLEPGIKEYKFYAPYVGLIKDGTLELVKYGYE